MLKNPKPHRVARIIFTGSIALATLAVFSAAADASDLEKIQSDAYRSSVAQDTLRQDAAAAQAELAALRDEIREFMPNDLTLVERAFNKLESLSHNEMIKAVAALRSASKAADTRAQLESLAGAQREQAAITTSLLRVSVDLNARQTLTKLCARVEELMRGQSGSLNETTRLAAITPDIATLLKGRDKSRYEAALGNQQGVSTNLKSLAEALDTLAKNLPDGPTREPISKVIGIAEETQLATASANALDTVRQGPLDKAVPVQRGIVSTLVAMLDVLKSSNSTLKERLMQITAEVRELAAAEKSIEESKELEKKPADLLARQTALADRTAALAPQLQGINNRAADSLEKAQANMEAAQQAMGGSKAEKKTAADSVKSASEKLAAAQAAINDQIAQADKAPATPQDLAAQLTQLQAATAQVAQEQVRPAGPAQKDALQKKVGELQEQAATTSPDAAKSLGDAASKIGEQDAASQKEAAQSLADAGQQLGQQLAALTGQSAAQQAMAKTESQIQQASKTTAQAQSNVTPGSQKSAEAVNQLNTASQQVAAAQQTASAPGVPQAAKDALAKAKQDLDKAKLSAAQVKLPDAESQSAAAQKALSDAKASLTEAGKAIAEKAAAAMAANAAGKPEGGENKPSSAKNSPPSKGADSQATAPKPGEASPDSGIDSSLKMGDGAPGGGSRTAGVGNAGLGKGPAQILTGLTPKDRDAISLLKTEKPPNNFVPEVQQYYKNLADGVGL